MKTVNENLKDSQNIILKISAAQIDIDPDISASEGAKQLIVFLSSLVCLARDKYEPSMGIMDFTKMINNHVIIPCNN